jgi:nucleoside-diphosphate-sugar epimerase
MKVLVLGGTQFVGHAVVSDANSRGWDVTLVNRGITGAAPAGARTVVADRTQPGALDTVALGHYDVVVDAWAGEPWVMTANAHRLAGSVHHWVYVSSRSVYAWPLPRGLDESGAVVEANPVAELTDYAADKRGSELALEGVLGPERVVCLRAGLILGPRENVGRLPWWLRRAARGGPMLAPGPRDLALQHVDARDLARFALDVALDSRSGPVNTVSPAGTATMGAVIDAVVAATGGAADPVWVDPDFLVQHGVERWTELPIWIPESDEAYALHDGDVSLAQRWGLRIRPIEETVRDTWAWVQEVDASGAAPEDRPGVGLAPDREAELLSLWHAQG